jgi:DNA topoisomerase-1
MIRAATRSKAAANGKQQNGSVSLPKRSREPQPTTPDPVTSAKEAGLRYVTDTQPGLRRKRAGKGFQYLDAAGAVIRDGATLARIRSLAIPPAWSDVWICARDDGHLQATGFDARHRKQYRYHPRWRKARDESKYGKMIAFAKALPQVRARVEQDLSRRGMQREKVLAAVVRLLETTLIRVGNGEYARTNESFGLTTMHNGHADVQGSRICFEFRGKSGVEHEIDIRDPRLAKIVAQCQELPGQELFQYVDDDGVPRDIGSADVNEYLREISGQDFTAKDFRTWAGTALAAQALREFEDFDSQAAAKRNITQAIERVAQRLGNTKTVCRKCYVHPAVIDAYLDRTLVETLKRRTEKELRESIASLPPEEAAVLALLQQRMERELGAPATRNAKKRNARRRVPR